MDGVLPALHVVHNPVDASWLAPAGSPRDAGPGCPGVAGIPAGVPYLLSVGAAKHRKGWDVLLRAFGRVSRVHPDVHLVLVGRGDLRSLQELAEELGMASSVHLVGPAGQEELAALYRGCLLFVLLPRNDRWHFEGFGLVYLEAAACGKPSVATRSGGVPEVVRDRETGLLVDEEDAPAAAAAIVELLSDPVLAAQLGNAAKGWAAMHSWPGYVDRMVALYEAALPGDGIRQPRSCRSGPAA